MPYETPDTVLEKTYTSFLTLLGTFVFTLLIRNVNAIIQAVDFQAEERRKRVQLVATFVNRERVSPQLRKQIFQQARLLRNRCATDA